MQRYIIVATIIMPVDSLTNKEATKSLAYWQ